jgi:hypothetical protein
VDSNERTFFVADAHRDDGNRFVVHADERLTAFVEIESTIRVSKSTITSQGGFGGQRVSVDLA